jgi:signal transduction histidine kinase
MIQRIKSAMGALDRMLRHSLSGRVFWLTILFVLLAEVFLWVPSMVRFHQDRLQAKLAAAQLSVLALEQIGPSGLNPELKREILANAEVRAVALRRDQTRQLFLAEPMPPKVDVTFDTRDPGFIAAAMQAFDTLLTGASRTMRVTGRPRLGGGELIEIVADERPLQAELIGYSFRIAQLSLIIALITGLPIFVSMRYFLVRPMQRLTAAMVRFQERPEDASRIVVPTSGLNEIAQAEQVLAAMQGELRQALQQKAHLAALGLAVAKIQHDLRNILTTAQLASDRLSSIDDPKVKLLVPRLIKSIDRAIGLANSSLRYGRAEEPPPRLKKFPLQPLLDEVSAGALAAGGERVAWEARVEPGLQVHADPDQLLRILLNIGRNAVEALKSKDGGRVTVSARRNSSNIHIDIADNGHGLPQKALDNLFQPFSGRVAENGTGLGLAIARELARGHGGDLTLIKTDQNGTTFRVTLPDNEAV